MHAPLWDLNLFFLSKWIFWIQNQGISSVPPQKSQWLHGHALQKHIQRHVLIESTQLHVKHTETRHVCEVRPGLILYYTNPTNNWHDVSLVYEWIIIKIPGKQQASKYMFTILCFFLKLHRPNPKNRSSVIHPSKTEIFRSKNDVLIWKRKRNQDRRETRKQI